MCHLKDKKGPYAVQTDQDKRSITCIGPWGPQGSPLTKAGAGWGPPVVGRPAQGAIAFLPWPAASRHLP